MAIASWRISVHAEAAPGTAVPAAPGGRFGVAAPPVSSTAGGTPPLPPPPLPAGGAAPADHGPLLQIPRAGLDSSRSDSSWSVQPANRGMRPGSCRRRSGCSRTTDRPSRHLEIQDRPGCTREGRTAAHGSGRSERRSGRPVISPCSPIGGWVMTPADHRGFQRATCSALENCCAGSKAVPLPALSASGSSRTISTPSSSHASMSAPASVSAIGCVRAGGVEAIDVLIAMSQRLNEAEVVVVTSVST